MKDKEGVWRLENWEPRPHDSDEQNDDSETVEST